MNNYSQHNIRPRTALKPVVLDTAVVHYDLRMEQIAQACGIDIEEIKGFNPQYKSTFIPGGRRRCTIALPQELIVKFVGIEDSIYRGNIDAVAVNNTEGADSTLVGREAFGEAETVAEQTEPVVTRKQSKNSRRDKNSKRNRKGKTVTVRSGDSLSKIAARNNTTVSALKRKNGLKGNRIHPGQKLRVR